MRTGRPKARLELTPDERTTLESLTHRSRTRPQTADQILSSIARFAQRTTDDHPADVMARTTGTGH